MSDTATKPTSSPKVPNFSSGPCAKRPGWSVDALKDSCSGRSHRSKAGKAKLQEVIDLSRKVLGVPADYRIGIVPGSDTGAVEMALWSLLGPRPVDVLAWEAFSQDWVTDIVKQLKLKDARTFTADYGVLPDLKQIDFSHDVVFAWNGTTSGVCVPKDFIPADREGLTICDATSAAFAMELPWDRLDVVTYSWQKVMGGEAAHGMLILSPRAAERLQTYTPPWPMPKLFRMVSGGKISEGIFSGETINTPSMLCVEDALDGLRWAESVGGLKGVIARTQNNFKALSAWVEKTPWIDFLSADPATRSSTSVCLVLTDPAVTALDDAAKAEFVKKLTGLLESEKVAYDIASYRTAPPGLRIWCGATVEAADIEALTPWLDWAYAQTRATLMKAA
jgi:phosphoserine aminotransferase